MAIKHTLRALMDQNGVTGYALSESTKVPQPTIHRILTGESADPKTATLAPIARFFGWTVSEMRDGKKVGNLVAQSASENSYPNQGMPTPQTGHTLTERLVTDPREAQLLNWYRRISNANKRKLYVQAELYCLEDDPDGPDPFEEAGIANKLKKAKKKNDKRDAVGRVPPARHGKGT